MNSEILTPAQIMGEEEEVNIYNEEVNIYGHDDFNEDVPGTTYTIKSFIDDITGGFNNPDFYDYCILIFAILVSVVCFRVVAILFGSK